MFKGWVLDSCYYTWKQYKKAYNEAITKGLLKDKKGNLITKCL